MSVIYKKRIKKTLLISCISIALLLGALLLTVLATNLTVVFKTDSKIFAPEDFQEDADFDCILVLGAGVRDGKPSDMLRDRLDTAIALYFDGIAPKLLLSGDHQSEDYDEVGVMRDYAMENGVPESNILLDHLGLSTYESVIRAKQELGIDSAIIVTQKYHLPRALYIADRIGVDAVGVCADTRSYSGAFYRSVREYAARTKDFFKCIF